MGAVVAGGREGGGGKNHGLLDGFQELERDGVQSCVSWCVLTDLSEPLVYVPIQGRVEST